MHMPGFTKLFNSILHSTIWSESNETRILWITMLAMADRNGCVNASIPGLARMAGISVEQTTEGLGKFLSPDAYSRTPDNEGRRVEVIEGGWHLLNHGKYRELMSAEERREYNRKKQAERRHKMSKSGADLSMTVNDNQQCQHSTEAEAEAEAIPSTSPASASPSGVREGKKSNMVPTTPQSKRVAKIFHRKLETPWTKKEVESYKLLGDIPEDDLAAVEAYYGSNWPPTRNVNILRHDLLTFLNNFSGEVDRANAANLPSRGKKTPPCTV